MPKDDKNIIEPINADFDEVAKAIIRQSKEISSLPNKINILSTKTTSKEISPTQGSLDLGIEMDAGFGEIGMGVLSDGTPYLNQRGLAALCGVQPSSQPEKLRQLVRGFLGHELGKNASNRASCFIIDRNQVDSSSVHQRVIKPCNFGFNSANFTDYEARPICRFRNCLKCHSFSSQKATTGAG